MIIKKYGKFRLYCDNCDTLDERQGARYISFSGTDRRDGYSGNGVPCNSLDEAIKYLDIFAARYDWKMPKGEQLSFLGGI